MAVKMLKCNEVQKYIKPYVEGNTDIFETIELIEHIEKCEDCYEELEIYYILINGLKKIDNDEDGAFNIKKELNDRIKNSKKKIRLYKSFREYSRLIYSLANISMIALMAYVVVRYPIRML